MHILAYNPLPAQIKPNNHIQKQNKQTNIICIYL